MNPTEFIRVGRVEVALLARVVERADHYRAQFARDLARAIVGEYAEASKRGRRR